MIKEERRRGEVSFFRGKEREREAEDPIFFLDGSRIRGLVSISGSSSLLL